MKPEEATDYDVGDGLPEDQKEEDEDELTLKCSCGAELELIVGFKSDIVEVAKASLWVVSSRGSICPRCQ